MNKDTIKIIAYGTLMTGERNHRFCQNAISIQPCTITGTLYDTGWGYPALLQEGDTTVHAELMEIPAADLPAMDRLEGYPDFYDRVQVPAKLEDGSSVEAWVYVKKDAPPQAVVIPSGNWKVREEYRFIPGSRKKRTTKTKKGAAK